MLAAFAIADVQHTIRFVEVLEAQIGHLAGAEARVVQQVQNGRLTRVMAGTRQQVDLGFGQHFADLFDPLGVGDDQFSSLFLVNAVVQVPKPANTGIDGRRTEIVLVPVLVEVGDDRFIGAI